MNPVSMAAELLGTNCKVLISAGAGMSSCDGYDVYTSPEDFAKHYPWMGKLGYRTSYECIGLFGDKKVSYEDKWKYQATHMNNMRWKFPPNEGYTALKELTTNKDYFIVTSNVDGMFEKAGFETDRIFTPQGDWAYYQCLRLCQGVGKSVWKSKQVITSFLNKECEAPTCPNCKGPVFGNVRISDAFDHSPYTEQHNRFTTWVENALSETDSVPLVIIEIGAGMSTPIVTRLPMEDLATRKNVYLVRINPVHHSIPRGVRGIAISDGWQALLLIHSKVKQQKTQPVAPPHSSLPQVPGSYGWRECYEMLMS
eukprot:TRINITY_DN17193_c0_g1_i1.p1 TRINITY_DN17193_c0_g1~~TRINITY_DN17193_c0_g1_i1.p1  ORF type:complete len:329 (+),score=37.43 TRINITY_DN17193_c0_g1_i1:56-988(+)